jgi:hypothetical protein
MIWDKATADDFFAANTQTRCINLLSLAAQQEGMAPLSRIAEFWRGRFETLEDIDLLRRAHVVRYKANSDGKGGWQHSGSSNFTTEEYIETVRSGKVDWKERRDIFGLVELLKEGLNTDVTLTAVVDNTLGARLIVDGLHRAGALILMRNENPGELKRLLASTYKVSIIELRSRWAHILYPFDFLDLCARQGP